MTDAKAVAVKLLQSISEMPEADPLHYRSICVDYENLYVVIEEIINQAYLNLAAENERSKAIIEAAKDWWHCPAYGQRVALGKLVEELIDNQATTTPGGE